MGRNMDARWVCAVALLSSLLLIQTTTAVYGDPQSSSGASASASSNQANGVDQAQQQVYVENPLDRLKQSISSIVRLNPTFYDQKDVDNFLADQGPVAATRFLNQRGQNSRRASKLAQNALKWRKVMQLSRLDASSFPCDLFKMGLIFEQGHAHRQQPTGEYVETNPVIWIRLGALGSIVKQLERMTPHRLLSFAVNSPREAWHKLQDSVSSSRQRHLRQTRAERRQAKRLAKQHRLVKNLSTRENETLMHVLRAVAWWLEDWVARHADGQKATLVLDFENNDFAFASWSVGEFFVKLDDMFPDLFDQIIGFRYKAKLWSLHSPISMFNRIFKSRVSSSPETDRKLRFVDREPQMGAYMPRVDAQGFTMLPEHVSGVCLGPDEAKAPAGCRSAVSADDGSGLYDPNFWQAIFNEFYYECRPRARQ